MKNNLLLWQVGGITFTAVLGTILHFLFEWTGLTILASVSAVNESTWEHMKLVYIPSLIFAIAQSIFAKNEFNCFWLIKLIGTLLGTLLIPILFYTLTGAFGTLSAVTNIAIFFISIIVEYFVELFLFTRLQCNLSFKWISIIILLSIFVLFVVFSYFPLEIPLFLDPLTNRYGITK